MDLQELFDKNTKEVEFEGEEVVVSTESFQKLLIDEDGRYTSDLAEELDEQIFFFLPDDVFNLSDEEIEEQLKDLVE